MHVITLFLAAAAGGTSAYTIVEADLFMHKNIDPVVKPGQYKVTCTHSSVPMQSLQTQQLQQNSRQVAQQLTIPTISHPTVWVPTLYYVDGTTYTEVPFSRFSAYYININSAEVAIPQNFKLVVSNSSATSQSDISPLSGVTWFCEGDASEIKDEAAFPTSTCSTHLQTLLLFHDCVHEETLESAYSGTQNWNTMFKAANRCSEGMKRMPQLRFSIRYDLRTILPGEWSGTAPFELACGTSYCSHGDFINGWLPEAAENMLNATSKTEFSEVTGPLGGDSDGAVCQNPVDADPDHGTDDYKTSLPMMQKRAIGRYDRRL